MGFPDLLGAKGDINDFFNRLEAFKKEMLADLATFRDQTLQQVDALLAKHEQKITNMKAVVSIVQPKDGK